MKNLSFVCLSLPLSMALIGVGGINSSVVQAQDPLPGEVVNAIAQKTITKFQNSSCQDLATSMAQSKQGADQDTLKDQLTARFIQKLRQDPQLTQTFFNQISTPVLTKLFECGLVPPQN